MFEKNAEVTCLLYVIFKKYMKKLIQTKFMNNQKKINKVFVILIASLNKIK